MNAFSYKIETESETTPETSAKLNNIYGKLAKPKFFWEKLR
jgi:hypothetical protein